ncbi:MAG: hypothetical protein AAF871_15405 [Pseudomonadota bacterium]
MGGFKLAEEARALRPDLPVIYMSGFTGVSAHQMGAVVALLVKKPSTSAELAAANDKALKSADSTRRAN